MSTSSNYEPATSKKPIKCDVDPAELPPYLTLLDEPLSTVRMPSEGTSLDAIALNAGWPPRVEGVEAVTRIDSDPPTRPFTDGSSKHGEVLLTSPVVGNESRVVLRVGLDWNSDLSVGVNFDARLYDGDSIDRTASNHFNVLRDHWQGWWVNLKSGEWPAPDRAHIDFTVTNRSA